MPWDRCVSCLLSTWSASECVSMSLCRWHTGMGRQLEQAEWHRCSRLNQCHYIDFSFRMEKDFLPDWFVRAHRKCGHNWWKLRSIWMVFCSSRSVDHRVYTDIPYRLIIIKAKQKVQFWITKLIRSKWLVWNLMCGTKWVILSHRTI